MWRSILEFNYGKRPFKMADISYDTKNYAIKATVSKPPNIIKRKKPERWELK